MNYRIMKENKKIKEIKKEIPYEYKMRLYDDSLTYRKDMDKNMMIMNIILMVSSIYMCKTSGWFIMPLICSLVSYLANIISDKLVIDYGTELTACQYYDEKFDKIAKTRQKNVGIVNAIYYMSFYIGLLAEGILLVINLY